MKPMLIFGALAFAAAAQTQLQPTPQAKADIEKMLATAKVMSIEGGVMGPAVKGAPYSADEIHESTQVLADGTRIHNETKTTTYRDGDGRIRRETGNEVAIWDPVSRTNFVQDRSDGKNLVRKQVFRSVLTKSNLDANQAQTLEKQQAAAQKAQAELQLQGQVQGGIGITVLKGQPATNLFYFPDTLRRGKAEPNSTTKTESLGTQSIEGIVSEGTRTTTTIPTGDIGNDRPINIVTERWYSPELQVVTMVKTTDPRTGEEVTRLTNIRRGAQDPSLFQVPNAPKPNQE